MEPVEILTEQDMAVAMTASFGMIDAGSSEEAVRYAEAAIGPEHLVGGLRSLTFIEAGLRLKNLDRIEKGAEPLRSMRSRGDDDPRVAYNLANAEFNMWSVAVATMPLSAALIDHRQHLHAARDLYREVIENDAAADDSRLQSLTNLANSFDNMGREREAMECYEEALAIRPTFGMALGNRGVTYLRMARFAGPHKSRLVVAGARSLEAALENSGSVEQYGGPRALQRFKERYSKVTWNRDAEPGTTPTWADDPYLRWCSGEGLFLHVSPECIRESDDKIDPLYFGPVTTKPDDADSAGSFDGAARINELLDAFNSLKRDYVTARYQLWLAEGHDSPIREQAEQESARTKYLDSLSYAQWGLRAGMVVQTFAATANLLDKVAALTHLYLQTSRKSKLLYFRTLWHSEKKGKTAGIEPTIAALLDGRPPNPGLLALCDLCIDLEKPTLLGELLRRRNTATHRFLVAHFMGPMDGTDTDWLERVSSRDLTAATLELLRIARMSLIYLVRLIDHNEEVKRKESGDGGHVLPLLLHEAESEKTYD